MKCVRGTNSVVIKGSTDMKVKVNCHSSGIAEGFESVSVISYGTVWVRDQCTIPNLKGFSKIGCNNDMET